MARILLIDDDRVIVPAQVKHAFPAPGHEVVVAESGAVGLEYVRSICPDVILLDLRLPDRSGLDVYEEIRAIDARIPVVFVTVTRAADAAIGAMKRGAFDYLFKPLDLAALRRTVTLAVDVHRSMRSTVVLSEEAPDAVPSVDEVLFGSCPPMLELYKAIGRVSAQDVTVLLTGESGTGKELVARAIYQHSKRAQAPFLALNCAAIPEPLLESELFGHEKGAFTGAERRRIGKFEQCEGGTLLLDEIGDMPPSLQPKILRFLQERTFERVGGGETLRSDVRVIAATHRDLEASVAAGQFRLDLFYRLSVFSIHLPPLRDRGDDLAALAMHYLRRFAGELGRDVVEIAPEAMDLLQRHPWPGNIRELQSVLLRAILQASGPVLLASFLPPLVPPPRGPSVSGSTFDVDGYVQAALAEGSADLYAGAHRAVDAILLGRILEITGGNQRKAARLLGIARQTLRTKLEGAGLAIPSAASNDDDGVGDP